MIHQNQLNKFEQKPVCSKIGFDIKIRSWYEEDYKTSANEQYGLGFIYFKRCGIKFINKPVKDFIDKLKNHHNYKNNKAFKHAINDNIKSDLLTEINQHSYLYSNRFYYVDSNGLVQDYKKIKDNKISLHDLKTSKEKYPEYSVLNETLWGLHILKTNTGLITCINSDCKFIIRINGLHYFVMNNKLDYFTIFTYYLENPLQYSSVLKLTKLSKVELKDFDLVDILEDPIKEVN